MAVIGQVLVQFIFRLTFGMAVAMAATPARLVSGGYYRVHLWVLMGLNTFAALALYSVRTGESPSVGTSGPQHWTLWLAITLAALSYCGAVIWLYERRRAGLTALALVAVLALAAALLDERWPASGEGATVAAAVVVATVISSSLLLGGTMAGMLLGHWYLNTPGMQLAPLERLIRLMTYAVLARAGISALGLALAGRSVGEGNSFFWMFLSFRWLAGLVGPLAMAWLARQTLKIPNTQSATGILYAGVILVFLGELVAQLLSVDTTFPL